jgi:hypothetical protein
VVLLAEEVRFLAWSFDDQLELATFSDDGEPVRQRMLGEHLALSAPSFSSGPRIARQF